MTKPALPPHTRRSSEVWEAARQDYVAGVSTAVIGERYGIDARSVRRRAVRETWRRQDAPAPDFDALRHRMEADHEAFPELAQVDAVTSQDLRDLLLLPDAASLSRFAFRKAAESAAMNGPSAAAAWLRVVRLTQAVGDKVDIDVRPYGPADYLRASMIAALADLDDPEESAESEMSPEISGGADSGG